MIILLEYQANTHYPLNDNSRMKDQNLNIAPPNSSTTYSNDHYANSSPKLPQSFYFTGSQ
jgi:hypothetical protein